MNKTTQAEKLLEAEAVITLLGGPSKVAKMCGIRQPSVSLWKRAGIPKGHRNFLKLKYPKAFSKPPS